MQPVPPQEFFDAAGARGRRAAVKVTMPLKPAGLGCQATPWRRCTPGKRSLDHAKAQVCDLIVMASHGRRGVTATAAGQRDAEGAHAQTRAGAGGPLTKPGSAPRERRPRTCRRHHATRQHCTSPVPWPDPRDSSAGSRRGRRAACRGRATSSRLRCCRHLQRASASSRRPRSGCRSRPRPYSCQPASLDAGRDVERACRRESSPRATGPIPAAAAFTAGCARCTWPGGGHPSRSR